VSDSTDIVVVGAGIVGCSIAFELSRRGASVRVVDDRPAGMGATQASAGMLAPFIESRENPRLTELTSRSLDLFDTFVSRVREASGRPVGYERSGTLDVALRHEALTALGDAYAALEARGVRASLLDAATVRSEEPLLTGDVCGGLLIPAHGHVAAGQLTAALADACTRQGAAFVDGGRVRRIAAEGASALVETSRGPIRGRRVVLAAGTWSGQIDLDGIDQAVPVRPVRGQLLQLRLAGPSPRRVLWSERCYLVPWADGAMLVGATVEDAGFDERTTAAGVHDLLEAACELVPHARDASFVAARAGLRPATPDQLPIIGLSSVLPPLVYACGHYRNGVLLAPVTAELVAKLILDGVEDPMLQLTSPRRFGAL
jgi:glycine oxidase